MNNIKIKVMTEEELLETKAFINESKQRESELKGERSAILRQLKEEDGCNSAEEVEQLIQRNDEIITRLSDELNQGMRELETELKKIRE